MNLVGNDWDAFLKEEFSKAYFLTLDGFITSEYSSKTVYPDYENILRALDLTPFHSIKAVILGQDPYHGYGEATGLAFSGPDGIRKPPSLRNIFKELEDDLRTNMPESGCLNNWSKNGVLLLNTSLTVIKDTPASHSKCGWETFTDNIISYISQKSEPVVFILWGKHAQKKKALIDDTRHLVIESAHPSPFAARKGFFGSKPFTRCNDFLDSVGREPVDWSL